ncbi:MAG: SDR family oxidoreductase [Oceanospirillaceae bacterium]|nr:SDR family oxidoreductase [Oceanospirillaceae bacterium]
MNNSNSPLRVLITGGASGIGLKIAEAFAASSAQIYICGTNVEKLEKCLSDHPSWNGSRCDISDDQNVASLVENAAREMAGIDVLVNNAGIAGPTASVEDCTPEEWRKTMDINVNGVFYGIHHAAVHLKESRGSIINISSVAGRIGYVMRSAYCASKFALKGITESLAKELGPAGVRVNSILPGFIESERWINTTKARAEQLGKTYPEMRAELLSKASLGSTVSEEEIAQMCLYLCSPAGKNISGQSLSLCANIEYL